MNAYTERVVLRSLLCVEAALMCIQSNAAPVRWNHIDNPVRVTENPAGLVPVLGLCAQSAFDGYWAQGSKPAAIRAWHLSAAAKGDAPISCEIDYGKPVAVSSHRRRTPALVLQPTELGAISAVCAG